MQDPKPPAAALAASTYVGWAVALMVLGGVMAVVSGLCTGAMVIGGIQSGGLSGAAGENARIGEAMVVGGLILGGIPCLIGIGLILAARKWGKRKTPSTNPDV